MTRWRPRAGAIRVRPEALHLNAGGTASPPPGRRRGGRPAAPSLARWSASPSPPGCRQGPRSPVQARCSSAAPEPREGSGGHRAKAESGRRGPARRAGAAAGARGRVRPSSGRSGGGGRAAAAAAAAAPGRLGSATRARPPLSSARIRRPLAAARLLASVSFSSAPRPCVPLPLTLRRAAEFQPPPPPVHSRPGAGPPRLPGAVRLVGEREGSRTGSGRPG